MTTPQGTLAPDDATHVRRPEYITAWLFDRGSTMPIWLITKYKSRPLPDDKIGHYATAVDGEFWRWFDPAKFNEMFVPLARQAAAPQGREAVIAECMEKIGNLRQSEAGLFDPAHSGQRGEDRSNALYDAYQLLRALALTPAVAPDGAGDILSGDDLTRLIDQRLGWDIGNRALAFGLLNHFDMKLKAALSHTGTRKET